MDNKKKNIKILENCYGCGICVLSCPKKIINLVINSRGFFEPYIDHQEDCIECGQCLSVCAFNDKNISVINKPQGSFAAWSNNQDLRKYTSSGGVMYEIGKYMLKEGAKVLGVRYDVKEKKAAHFLADNDLEWEKSRGSKYLQSYTVDALAQLDIEKKIVFVGTPCQVDSLRRFARKKRREDNFLFVDFFCHGVPSYHLWDKYCKMVEETCGKILQVSWRNKENGWHDSWRMRIKGERDDIESPLSKGDMFYRIFLSDTCLNKACYKNCKYKYDKSAADIRIGDLWGYTYNKNEEGVSAVVCFTQKGLNMLSHIDCEVVEHPFEVVAEGQMKKSPPYNLFVRYIQSQVRGKTDIVSISRWCGWYIRFSNIVYLVKHPAFLKNKLKNFIHR